MAAKSAPDMWYSFGLSLLHLIEYNREMFIAPLVREQSFVSAMSQHI